MTHITKILILILFILTTSSFGQNPDQKSIAVTVYNANLGVVKDLREMDIKS